MTGGGATRTAEAAVIATGISKTFPGVKALSDLNLTVGCGEIRAIVGGNGSGKSTLIKILSGYYRSDPGGKVTIGGQRLSSGPLASYRLGARFVHQDLGLIPELSVLDNLAMSSGFPTKLGTVLSGKARERADSMLAAVGMSLNVNRRVKELAPAEATGVALARSLHGVSEGLVKLLVLDEPTATLPAPEVRVVLDMVRLVASRDIGVLYVTHRIDEIYELGASVTVIRDGREIVTADSSELQREALVQNLMGEERATLPIKKAKVARSSDAAPLLSAANLYSKSLRGFSFEVSGGEVLGISGVTGSGRDELLSCVFGATGRTAGVVRISGKALSAERPDQSVRQGVAFVPSDRKALGGIMTITARENVMATDSGRFWKGGFIRRGRESAHVKSWFTRLGVRPVDGLEAALSTFSGGNQQKLILAKWLRRNPSLLLLDEPTQGVDLPAKAVIHREIADAAAAGCGVVISSADIDELVDLADRVIILRDGARATELSGDHLNVANVTHETLGATSHQTLKSIKVEAASQ